MDELAKKWLIRAEYDLKTANCMFKTKRYLYVAFMCQQAIEKLLKTLIAQKGKEIPPIHNLVRLSEIAGIYPSMSLEYQEFLADLTPFAIEARYGDYRKSLSEIINQEGAKVYLLKTKEIFKWLKQKYIK